MRSNCVLMLLALCWLSCSSGPHKKENIRDLDSGETINNSDTSAQLFKFVEDFLKNRNVKSDVVTLNSIVSGDSLRFLIIDAYPDFDSPEFLGYTKIKGRMVCIVGHHFPSMYLKIDNVKVPDEVVEKFNTSKEFDESISTFKHPLFRSICFLKLKVIACPK